MKKLLLLLTIVLFASCESKETKIKNLEDDIFWTRMDSSVHATQTDLIKFELRYSPTDIFNLGETYYTKKSAIDSINYHTNILKEIRKELQLKRKELSKLK